MSQNVIIGLQIEKDKGQISFCHPKMNEPQTVNYGVDEMAMDFPIAAYKYKGENRFIFGKGGYEEYENGTCVPVENFLEAFENGRNVVVEDREYQPEDILEAFLSYLISQVPIEEEMKIEAIAVCTEMFQRRFLDAVQKSLNKLYPNIQLFFMRKEDCFAYYALSMKIELHQNYVGLFAFDGKELSFLRLEKKNDKLGKRIVLSGKNAKLDLEEGDLDQQMLEFAQDCIQRDIYSAIYLTGKGYENSEFPQFVAYICGRRRAFLGQNLYSKGACYGAYDLLHGEFFANQLIVGTSRVMWNLDVEFLERGAVKGYRLIYGGKNWYEEVGCADFIIREKGNLKLYFSSLLTEQILLETISLEEIVKDNSKISRIRVMVDFLDEFTMNITISDLGFGEIYPSSGCIISKKFHLGEDSTWKD